jgi:hypothetical protein
MKHKRTLIKKFCTLELQYPVALLKLQLHFCSFAYSTFLVRFRLNHPFFVFSLVDNFIWIAKSAFHVYSDIVKVKCSISRPV